MTVFGRSWMDFSHVAPKRSISKALSQSLNSKRPGKGFTTNATITLSLFEGLNYRYDRNKNQYPKGLRPVRKVYVRSFATGDGGQADTSTGGLVHWVVEQGGLVQGVAIHSWHGEDGGSGLGLRATRRIHMGEELVVLPESLHLTYRKETDPTRELVQLMDRIPEELWGAKLAVKLIHERLKGQDGFFWPYIANLPVGFPGLPLFFESDAIRLIEYPSVSHQIIKRCKWLLQFSEKELKSSPSFSNIDANAFAWAFAAVTSRAFRPGGPTSPGTMLPLIDMCNHSFAPNARVVGTSRPGDLAMLASKDIQENEPILLSYGKLPNDFLLLDYGFVVDGNPYDTVTLGFDVGFVEAAKAVANVGSMLDDSSSSPKLTSWQKKLLDSLGVLTNKEVNIIWTSSSDNNGCPVDDRLLAAVRVLCATKEADCKKYILTDFNTYLPSSWEVSSCKTLIGMCLVALSQFSCSSQQDSVQLENANGDNAKLAIQLRRGKKDLLSNAMKLLKQRIQLVEQQRNKATNSPASSKSSGARNKKASTSASYGKDAQKSKGFQPKRI